MYLGVRVVYSGKFGKVCMCTELSSGEMFAAKFIRARAAQRCEFHQEIEVMNILRHPKILLLWDAFESTRELILVMEQLVSARWLMSHHSLSVCLYAKSTQIAMKRFRLNFWRSGSRRREESSVNFCGDSHHDEQKNKRKTTKMTTC